MVLGIELELAMCKAGIVPVLYSHFVPAAGSDHIGLDEKLVWEALSRGLLISPLFCRRATWLEGQGTSVSREKWESIQHSCV